MRLRLVREGTISELTIGAFDKVRQMVISFRDGYMSMSIRKN